MPIRNKFWIKKIGGKMKKLLFIIIFSIVFTLSAIEIPAGSVSGTWTAADNPYNINGDIEVEAGTSLTIEPGVEIHFSDSYLFWVHGQLTAEGDEAEQILFTAPSTGSGWRGLRFVDSEESNSLSFCVFENGIAHSPEDIYIDKTGGLVHCSNSSNLVIDNCTFFNGAAVDGGAIALFSSDITITNSSFNGNDATVFGGAIYIEESAPLIENCILKNNNTAAMGTICAYNFCDVIVRNTTIASNTGGASTGFYATYSDAQLINILMHSNESEMGSGGAAGFVGSDVYITNCTITENISPTAGGAFWAIASSNVSVTNSIFWENSPQDINMNDGVLEVNYSNIQDEVFTGDGNISEQPLFVDVEEFDFHLQATSGCIDAGTPDTANLNLPEFDIDGNIRIADGNDDGTATIDMGVYELAGGVQFPALEDLTADIIEYNSIELNWVLPDEELTEIEIYRNGELAETIASNSTSWSDEQLAEDVYEYELIAIYVEGESLPVSIEVSLQFVIPENLSGEIISEDPPTVSLIWDFPTIDRDLVGFNLYRDDEMVAEIASDITNYDDILSESGTYEYFLTAVYSPDYESIPSNVISVEVTVDTIDDAVELTTSLLGNYPNPFNPKTNIAYQLENDTLVNLSIYNVRGQKINTLVNNLQTSGKHTIVWNGDDVFGNPVSSGIYYYRLTVENKSLSKKMILIK